MPTRRLAGLALVATILWSGAAQAQRAPAQATRAYQALQDNAQMVMGWVYPSVTFERLDGCRWDVAGSGYKVWCRFAYADDGDHETRMLAFWLDGDGLITSIEDLGGDSVFPAFTFLRVTKKLVSAMARSELESNPHGTDEDTRALLRLLARSPEPEQVLAWLLNIQILRS